ncbi:hypothetical protein GVAV_001251 [Gurleya vavrai]
MTALRLDKILEFAKITPGHLNSRNNESQVIVNTIGSNTTTSISSNSQIFELNNFNHVLIIIAATLLSLSLVYFVYLFGFFLRKAEFTWLLLPFIMIYSIITFLLLVLFVMIQNQILLSCFFISISVGMIIAFVDAILVWVNYHTHK